MAANGKALIHDEILGRGPQAVPVAVPEWGGTVYLRPLGGDDRDWLDATVTQARDDRLRIVGLRREVVGRCLANERGEPLNPTPEQMVALGKADGAVLDRLFQKCQEISGLLGAASVEEAAKN